MKNLCFCLAAMLLAACGGSLSDEQRKQIRENMEDGEIKRITESAMTAAAYELGRSLIAELTAKGLDNQPVIDSLEQQYNIRIVTLQPSDSLMLAVEQQIIEAYTAETTVPLTDNIQKLGADSLLYTKPVMTTLPDGAVKFERAIGIHMPRKTIVRSIED